MNHVFSLINIYPTPRTVRMNRGLSGIITQLSPKGRDMHVDGPVINVEIPVGHGIQKLFPGQRPSPRPGQAHQELIFDGRQIEAVFVQKGFMGTLIDPQGCRNATRFQFSPGPSRSFGTA